MAIDTMYVWLCVGFGVRQLYWITRRHKYTLRVFVLHKGLVLLFFVWYTFVAYTGRRGGEGVEELNSLLSWVLCLCKNTLW